MELAPTNAKDRVALNYSPTCRLVSLAQLTLGKLDVEAAMNYKKLDDYG